MGQPHPIRHRYLFSSAEKVTQEAIAATQNNVTTICSTLTESGHYVVVGPIACIEKILLNKPLGQCHTINADIRSAKIKKVLASREATADVTVRSGWTPCTLTL